MWIRVTGLLLVAGISQISGSRAQNVPSSAGPEVSICALLKEPRKFDNLKITVHGEVVSEFEDFSILDRACRAPNLPGIWLMFGGDVDCPTPSTWNDVGRPKGKDVKFQGVSYPLVKDGKFREFYRFATRRKRQKEVLRVKATLEGTFFAGAISTNTDPRMELPGFGHLGCCYLFIIHRVLDVSAEKPQ
jgi:hypothetical protein